MATQWLNHFSTWLQGGNTSVWLNSSKTVMQADFFSHTQHLALNVPHVLSSDLIHVRDYKNTFGLFLTCRYLSHPFWPNDRMMSLHVLKLSKHSLQIVSNGISTNSAAFVWKRKMTFEWKKKFTWDPWRRTIRMRIGVQRNQRFDLTQSIKSLAIGLWLIALSEVFAIMLAKKLFNYLFQMPLPPDCTQDHLVCRWYVPGCPYPNGRHQDEPNVELWSFCHCQIHPSGQWCRGREEETDFSGRRRDTESFGTMLCLPFTLQNSECDALLM